MRSTSWPPVRRGLASVDIHNARPVPTPKIQVIYVLLYISSIERVTGEWASQDHVTHELTFAEVVDVHVHNPAADYSKDTIGAVTNCAVATIGNQLKLMLHCR